MASSSSLSKLPESTLFQQILSCQNEADQLSLISAATPQDLSILFKALVNPSENDSLDGTPNEPPGISGKQIKEDLETVKNLVLKTDDCFKVIMNGFRYKITHENGMIDIEIYYSTKDSDLKFLKDRILFLEKSFPAVKINIDLAPGNEISCENLIQFMSDHKEYVHILDLRGKNVNDIVLSSLLKYCSNINHLYIKSNKIKGDGLVGINNLRHLQSLNLAGCSDLSSITLSDLPALRALYLSDCSSLASITLSDLPALTQLHLTCCSSLASLTLSKLPVLRVLNLSFRQLLTSITLSDLPALMELHLSNCRNLASLTLSDLPALKELSLLSCESLSSITLSDFPALILLNLFGCASLASLTLSNLPIFIELNLAHRTFLTSLTLSDLPALREIGMSDCSSMASLTLSDLPALKMMNLHRCTSLASLTLSNLPTLSQLMLSDCSSLNSLMLSALPALTILELKSCSSLQFTQQLALMLFNLAKSSTNVPFINLSIRRIAVNYGEDHEYVQQLIHHLILNIQHTNPDSPYRIHRELLEKEALAVEHRPEPYEFGSIHFNINTAWIQEPPQLPYIPFTYSKFESMLNKIEQKLGGSSKALNTFEAFFPDYSFDNLKKDISAGFYRQYLDSNMSEASSSSAPPQNDTAESQNRLCVTSCRLRKILQCIVDQDIGVTDDDLTDGDKAFIQMLINVRTCGSGKITGVDHTYYSIAEDKIYEEAELEKKGPLERITFYIKEELRRRRYNVFPLENVHNKTYQLNLLGRELGLYAKGEKPKIDMNGNGVSLSLRSVSKQEALNHFYNTYTTNQLVEWVYHLFNGDQIQIGNGSADKWAVVSNTLNNTQEGDAEAKVWDPRYIQFDKEDTLQYVPLGITHLGAAMIITKMGILTAIGK